MIRGINHITFATTKLDESIAFYSEILGGNLKVKWEKGAYLELGNVWLAINRVENFEVQYNDMTTHIAFTVEGESFLQLKEKLISIGVVEYKKNTSEGNSFYFNDPDGHKLEIHTGNLDTRLKWIKDNNDCKYELYE